MDLNNAKNHFENALRNVSPTDYVTGEFIKGLIDLTKFLEGVEKTLEQIDASTR